MAPAIAHFFLGAACLLTAAVPVVLRYDIDREYALWLIDIQAGYPQRGKGTVAALVLLGGVTNVPRVKELQQIAIEAQENIDETTDESEDHFLDLMDSDGELESLF